jgi:hypothetical protein
MIPGLALIYLAVSFGIVALLRRRVPAAVVPAIGGV